MKILYCLATCVTILPIAAHADAPPLRPLPHPPLIMRPIPMKPEFKNVVIRGIARQGNYSASAFLTNPDVRNDFNPAELSAQGQRLYNALHADVLAHLDGFSQNNLTALVNDFATESSGVDIEALAWLVMQDAAQNADADLKSILDGVKNINRAKQALRDQLNLLNALAGSCHGSGPGCGGLSAAEIAAAKDKAQKDLDSLSEMGEMESLRLQMAMDRLSKLMSSLSNILKKISDTSQSITQNLK